MTTHSDTDLDLFGRDLPLHPTAKPLRRTCPVCGLATLRAVDADHRLCAGCAEDTQTAMGIVEGHLHRIERELEEARGQWTAYMETLDTETAVRWNTLYRARKAARVALDHARTATRKAGDDARYQAHLETVERAWQKVTAKIARTRTDAGNPLAAILDKEVTYQATIDRLTRDRQRWEMTRSDVEIARDGSILF